MRTHVQNIPGWRIPFQGLYDWDAKVYSTITHARREQAESVWARLTALDDLCLIKGVLEHAAFKRADRTAQVLHKISSRMVTKIVINDQNYFGQLY